MDSSVQVIYVDVIIVTIGANFLFDWLLLWATAEVTKTKTTRLRLLAATTLGCFHFALYLLAAYGVVGYYGLLRFPLTVGLVSLVMLIIAFQPVPVPRHIFRLAGTFYVILSVSAGAGLAVGNLLAYGGRPHALVSNLAAIGALLLVAEVGWGVLQRRMWRGLYHVPIEVRFDERSIHIMALVDTGNQLTDPLTQSPVIVIEMQAMRELFPEGLQHDVAQLAQGDFGSVSSLVSHSAWSSRLRLIPFSSLGQENGLLIGFKPDLVRIMLPQVIDVSKRVIVGLANHPLDRDGQYQALLHPSMLESIQGIDNKDTSSTAHTVSIQSDKGGNSVVDTIS